MAIDPELYQIIEAHLRDRLYDLRVYNAVDKILICYSTEIGVLRFSGIKAKLYWPDNFPEGGPVADPVPIDFHDPDSFKRLDNKLQKMRGEIITPLQHALHYLYAKEWWERNLLTWGYLVLAFLGTIFIVLAAVFGAAR